jgi:hypothetical protein
LTGRVPTRIGDVLILTSPGGGGLYALGGISVDGQQDLHYLGGLQYVKGRQVAESEARLLVIPNGDIYLRDIHTGEWDEIPN